MQQVESGRRAGHGMVAPGGDAGWKSQLNPNFFLLGCWGRSVGVKCWSRLGCGLCHPMPLWWGLVLCCREKGQGEAKVGFGMVATGNK